MPAYQPVTGSDRMTTIKDSRGYGHSLTPPAARRSAVPWHYATEHLYIAYRTDPAAIAA